nr:reverse transcriptase domain-containing protein [Tanacetum cinerariifolium]
MDYFTKWKEAKAVATITGGQVKKFVWDNIVCRFGISGEIISDNGKQFSDNPFKDWCDKLNIIQSCSGLLHKVDKAKAVATIMGGQVKKFVWDNIVCPFGLPGEIVSNNSKQFSDNPFKDWCDKLNITQRFTSVKHPQSNGLVERANQSLGEGIKARLAAIPTEIGMPTYRTAAVDVVSNDEELRLNLDMLEERRKRAAIREAKAKSKMMEYYNARVRGVTFRPGDFVYHSNEASHAVAGVKLGPKWEGPYEVSEVLGDGAYKLRSMDGIILPRTWNIAILNDVASNHGDIPFFLTYGTEAVIPTEIGMSTYRTAAVDVVSNDEELRLNLDMLEERRKRAVIREAKAKSKMMEYYNARVRG